MHLFNYVRAQHTMEKCRTYSKKRNIIIVAFHSKRKIIHHGESGSIRKAPKLDDDTYANEKYVILRTKQAFFRSSTVSSSNVPSTTHKHMGDSLSQGGNARDQLEFGDGRFIRHSTAPKTAGGHILQVFFFRTHRDFFFLSYL